MNREIKFRGKPIEAELPSGEKLHGGFVYGSLLQGNGLCRILVPVEGAFKNYRVDPETVGQFTGWRDGGGNEIYEGDIAVAYTYGQGYTGEVIFTEASFGIKTKADGILFAGDFHFIDVLGNVFDNPELLKGGAK